VKENYKKKTRKSTLGSCITFILEIDTHTKKKANNFIMKCTPASSLTFTGTISVNGNETRYNNEVVPIPAGFNNFCISRNGKVMNVQAITPMGTYNNNINDDNGHLTGTMKFPFMTIKLDGNGKFK